ncbi:MULTISPECIES: MFS transporter [Actinomycetes]
MTSASPTPDDAGSAAPDGAPPDPPARRVMVALLTPLFAALMSISIVNVALPAIESGLGAGSSDLQWVLSGYALAFGVVLVPAGRAGDLWGRRRFFLLGVAVFGLASLMSALAPTPMVLNIARVLMGVGAGLLTPQIIGMIQQLFRGSARGRAYGLMSTVIGVAVAAGPAIGGLIIDVVGDDLGWRTTFLINAPLTLLAFVLAFLWLPRTGGGAVTGTTSSTGTRTGSGGRRGLAALDPLGVALLSAAVVLVMLPFIQFRSGTGAFLGAAGLALMTVWAFWERRLGRLDAEAPMVNLALFTRPSYTLNTLVLSLYFLGMPAVWAVVAVYVQQGLGHGALVAGVVTLPSAVMVMLLSTAVGRRVETSGPRMLVVGTVIAVLSMLALAGATALMGAGSGSLWLVGAALALNGLSQALIIPSAQTLSMQDVPARMAGAAGGVAQTSQRLFTAVGIALVTGVYFSIAAAVDHHAAVLVASLAIAACMLSAVLAAVLAARRARRAPAAAS